MKSPGSPIALPIDYASDLAIEMHLMRGECSDIARTIMEQTPVDFDTLQECALLDEALARAHSILITALRNVKASRDRRQHGDD